MEDEENQQKEKLELEKSYLKNEVCQHFLPLIVCGSANQLLH